MPRVRRKRVDVRDYSERTRRRLLDGHDWSFLGGDELSEEELRAAWEELRDELIDEHMREYPGERPWAWWAWDHGMEPPLQLHNRRGETDYLDAHDLLTREERRQLDRRALTPARPSEDGGRDE